MTLEERKNNTYFDQSGKQILVGDLLKVFHFRSRNRNYYMYHVVVMEGTTGSEKDFPVMALKDYYAEKTHYRMYTGCNNNQRVYFEAKIIAMRDWETKRQKIKVVEQIS